MSKKAITGGLATLILTACGQAVGETDKVSKAKAPNQIEVSDQALTKDELMSALGESEDTGWLPDTVSPDVTDFQTRLIAELEKGIPEEVFSATLLPPSKSISLSGPKIKALTGPELKDGKYKMFLVREPISRLTNSDVLECKPNKSLYRATIAARPFLISVPRRTEERTISVRPYEIHICDHNGTIKYAIKS